MSDRPERWTKTRVDPDTGRLVRICNRCGVEKDLETGFANRKKPKPGQSLVQMRRHECRACIAEYKRQWYRRKMQEDPEGMRERQREYARTARATNPDRFRAASKRWWERVKNDPERHARLRESQRLWYRLSREQRGATVTRIIRARYVPKDNLSGSLPAKPLADAIERMIRRREAGNMWDALPVNANDQGGQTEIVCQELGTQARRLYEWRTGRTGRVQLEVAERILTRGGWLWWDVWDDTTVPDPAELARITALFEGEQEVAA